jgi:hypothetical protein
MSQDGMVQCIKLDMVSMLHCNDNVMLTSGSYLDVAAQTMVMLPPSERIGCQHPQVTKTCVICQVLGSYLAGKDNSSYQQF